MSSFCLPKLEIPLQLLTFLIPDKAVFTHFTRHLTKELRGRKEDEAIFTKTKRI
jgi:hypothetical protein